jgi:phosphoglycerol transferase
MPLTTVFSAGALTMAFALAAWVLARPHKKPYTLGMLSALCLLIGLANALGAAWAPVDWHVLPLIVAAIVLIPVWIIARGFGRVDLMAIAIHTGLGMKGGTLKGYENEIYSSLVVVSVAALSIWGLHNVLSTGPWLLWVGTAALVALNPVVRHLAMRLVQPKVRSSLLDEYREPAPLQRPDTLPDVVVIYVEGVDRRFLDTTTFGDLAEPLARLESQGLSFTGVRQIAGTGWSLAGMVATLSGVPVLPNGLRGKNKLGGIEDFMGTVASLGDVLDTHGYAMDYIVGADPRFAGIDVYYRTHKIGVIGLAEQIAMHPPEDVEAARIDRILDDQMTFDSGRLRQAALAEGEAPYLLVVETVGPHGRTGYLSRRATPDGKGVKSRDAHAVVRSLIDETVAFIDDIRARQDRVRPDRPLRIVVMSDHLSHNVNLPRGAEAFAARNTVLFLGDGTGQVAREGSMVDVYPTLLEWLGFAGPGAVANMGRSLLSPTQTLVETYGVAQVDRILTSDAALAARLWTERKD